MNLNTSMLVSSDDLPDGVIVKVLKHPVAMNNIREVRWDLRSIQVDYRDWQALEASTTPLEHLMIHVRGYEVQRSRGLIKQSRDGSSTSAKF